MGEGLIVRILRQTAWERAKGEMKSMTHSYWDDYKKNEAFRKALDDFIEKVESERLHK